MLPLPPRSTLFPYTTLFRSSIAADLDKRRAAVPRRVAGLVAFDEAQVVKPRVRGIENSESVLPRLDGQVRSEEHTSELQSLRHLVCRLLLEKKKKNTLYSQN